MRRALARFSIASLLGLVVAMAAGPATATAANGTIILHNNARPANLPDLFTYHAGGGLSPTVFQMTGGFFYFQDVAPGSGYSLSQDATPGWDLASASCNNGSPVSNISVGSGETVMCTFNNDKRGRLTILQDTEPDGAQDFNFTTGGGLGPASFTLDDDGDGTNEFARAITFEVPFGTYSVTQQNVPGWSQVSACTDGSPVSSINLARGEGVLCKFRNGSIPPPPTLLGLGGIKGLGDSTGPVLSADGEFVAFESTANNLSPADPDASSDVFLRGLRTGNTVLVSQPSGFGGVQGSGASYMNALSGDGRYVVFESLADLETADAHSGRDVFIRDTQTGTTTIVSQPATGPAPVYGNSADGSVSADGRLVAFESATTRLTADDPDATEDVYVRDVQTSDLQLVSRATGPSGAKANGQSLDPAISADGRYVAFSSRATNLDPADTDTWADVYVRDLATGTTTLVSRADGAAGPKGDSTSLHPSISADGRYVAFDSISTNLGPDDNDPDADVFVRDLANNTTVLASRADGASGTAGNGESLTPFIAADGSRVAFTSTGTNLAPDDRQPGNDTYVRDLGSSKTFLASGDRFAGLSTGSTPYPSGVSLSADGHYVSFASTATTLVPGDDSFADVYVRDLPAFFTSLDSRATAGYPRPQGATPMFVPLVPAYNPCGSPNRVHASPLSFGSCSPPSLSSAQLTTGTPDSNGATAKLTGSVRLMVLPGDASIKVDVTDVRRTDLSDYAGELRLSALLRVTDRSSPRNSGEQPGPATVTDVGFGPSIPCTTTVDPTIGSTCAINTSVNALIPGAVTSGARSVWELGQITLMDGGPDGDGDTTGDNAPFLRQGLFVP